MASFPCRLASSRKRFRRRLPRLQLLERRELLAAEVLISEFLSSNSSTFLDGNGRSSDWIELHNSGDQAAELAGWHLTDEPGNLDRWTFPDVASTTLDPGDFLVLFASGDGVPDPSGNLHTNFSLSASSGYLALVRDDLSVAWEFGPGGTNYPPQQPNVSYGVDQAVLVGDPTRFFLTPTPGAANRDAVVGFVQDTSFSVDRGYFAEAFTVDVWTPTIGATLVYTTDGSQPTLSNGTQVTSGSGAAPLASVSIATTTTLRAAAFKTGYQATNTDTQTYLFLDDVIDQPSDPTGFPTAWGSAPAADYAMDPQITEDASYSQDLLAGLRELPAISLVSDVDGIFGADGIYSNPEDGDLEIPVSAEYLLPDGTSGFQIDAGLKIAGGASRRPNNSPKHSMSLRFRSIYGASKLEHDLFDGSPVNEFNSLQLRAVYNNSWIHWDQGQRGRGTLIRDQFVRDSLIAAGQDDAGRGHYTHVYLNGLYWGVYNLHERADSSHYAEHQGGKSGEFDALNGGVPIDGTVASWNNVKSTVATKDWNAIQTVIDVDNFIDWTLVQAYGGNADLKVNGNWRAAGGGSAGALWRMYAWDSERILEGVRSRPPDSITDATGMFGDLIQVPEFLVRFGDRIQKHFTGDGAFTPEASIQRWNMRATQLENAIVAESARWGDYRRDVHPRGATPLLYRRDQNWTPEVNRVATAYFPARTEFVYDQFVALGWMSSIKAPEYRVDGNLATGGVYAAGSSLSLTTDEGTIYYTTDGSDPRLEGGAIAPGAIDWDPSTDPPPIILDESLEIRARTRDTAGDWSAVHDALFLIPNEPASAANLRITEINYAPAVDGDAEYLELRNITSGDSGVTVDLDGVTLTDGPSLPFVVPVNTKLLPGQSALLVRDIDAFTAVYPDVEPSLIVGEYAGKLSNSGERIRLVGTDGVEIADLEYGTGDPWPKFADGIGGSLTLKAPLTVPASEVNKPYHYVGSVSFGGSPGTPEQPRPGVVINEILAHTDAPLSDSIELFNPTEIAIDLGGWYLSDDGAVPKKYRIPDGTFMDPGEHLVFDEADFNPSLPTSASLQPFALNASQGDSVWLFVGDGSDAIGFVDHVSFDATFNGLSIGRIEGSGGRLIPLANRSLGTLNGVFRKSDLVITEINYHPSDPSPAALQILPALVAKDLEFIEIENATSGSIDLMNWRLRGESDFDFEVSDPLAGGEAIAIVSFDPDDPQNASRTNAFRTHYGIDSAVRLVGPFSGSLSNRDGIVKLQAPDQPPADDPTLIPRVTVDEVFYDDLAPWPVTADGAGKSLQRIAASTLGTYADSWRGETPTPGNPAKRAVVQSVTINQGSANRSSVTSVEVRFDREVHVDSSAFVVTHRETEHVVGNLQLTTDSVGGQTIATISFRSDPSVVMRGNQDPSLVDGNYTLRIIATEIVTVDSDATMAFDYHFGEEESDSFFRHFGDTDGDRDVDGVDYGRFGLTFLQAEGQEAYDPSLDFDGDGEVDGQDYARFGRRLMRRLPF